MWKRPSDSTLSDGTRRPGLVIDSSVLVAAERSRVTTPEIIGAIREAVGDVAIVICSLTVAELAHGIYRA